MMHGKGVFEWLDKRKYDGEYIEEKKEGYGTFYWPDGRVYKGQWKDGVQHGEGTLYDNGTETAGMWDYGKFQVQRGQQNGGSDNKAMIVAN